MVLLVGGVAWIALDIHGRVRLAQFQKSWAAKGVELRYDHLTEPIIAPEDNFLEAPMFVEFRDSENDPAKGVRFEALDRDLIGALTTYPDERREYLGHGRYGMAFGWLMPLDAELSSPAQTDRENAQLILKALAPFEDLFNEFIEAANRPECHEAWEKSDQVRISMPRSSKHLVMTIVRFLQLRARAHLHNQDSTAAFRDVETLCAVAAHFWRRDESLIGHMFAITFQTIALHLIWEGLYLQSWNDEQLEILDQRLASLQIPDLLPRVLQHDLAFTEQLVRIATRDLSSRREAFWATGLGKFTLLDPPGFDLGEIQDWVTDNVRTLVLLLLPQGAFLEEVRALQSIVTDGLIAPAGVLATQLTYDDLQSFQASIAASSAMPQLRFVLSNPVNFASVAMKSFEIQQNIELARIAVALERHYLASQTYPENLSELVPNFLPVVPPDIFDLTRPITYQQVAENDRYLLYSVGPNQVDDGGKAVRRGRLQTGDVVWQYTEVPVPKP